MPYIIILTGHPCSGKSTLAHLIRDRALSSLTTQQVIDTVVIVNEPLAAINHSASSSSNSSNTRSISSSSAETTTTKTSTQNQLHNDSGDATNYYSSSATEKVLRAGLKSAFDRAVALAVHDETTTTTTTITTETPVATSQHQQERQQQDQEHNSNNSRSTSKKQNNTTMSKRKKTLIILDSTNYIKGYRYELYCICKAAGANTSCHYCVVWCLNDVPTVRNWNQQRNNNKNQNKNTTTSNNSNDSNNDTNYYSNELLDALILRYEPPDERNRWDRPLYCIDVRPNTDTIFMTITKLPQQQQQDENDDVQQSSTLKNRLAEQLLQQSLYNMHNLSDAISTTTTSTLSPAHNQDTAVSAVVEEETLSSKVVVAVPNGVTKSTGRSTAVKRSAFQKRTTSTTSTTTTLPVSLTNTITSKPMTLTAEALSSLNVAAIASTTSNHHQGMTTTTTKSATTTCNQRQSQKQSVVARQQQQQHGKRTVTEQVDEMLLQLIQTVQPLKEGTSTRQQPSVESDVLHMVDTITQQLCNIILVNVRNNNHGNYPDTTTTTTTDIDPKTMDQLWMMPIPFQNTIWYLDCSSSRTNQQQHGNTDDVFTVESLRQIRTKYIQWIRKHPMEELFSLESQQQHRGSSNSVSHRTKVIIESFLSYITTQIQQQ